MALRAEGFELHAACERGEVRAAARLLDRGAEVNLRTPKGLSALMMACKRGYLETAKLLLDRGAKVDLQKADHDGWTALMLACRNGETDAAKLLLDRGAKVDLQKANGRTALMLACRNGKTDAAKLLLDRGAEVDLQDKDGWTALRSACAKGHMEAEKLLLDRGAEVDLQDSDGSTALIWACENGHLETAKLLLDRGAKMDLQEKKSWSALMLACQNGHPETAKLLLDRGAKVHLQTKGGWSALIPACQNGHPQAAKLLLDRGAKVDLQNSDGWTALMFTCGNGHPEAAKLLLDRGAKVDLKVNEGWTALMLACQEGHSEAAKLLLDRGAEVDLQDKDGWTALMSACDNGRMEAAKLLLDRGAEVDFQDSDGSTALILTCENGHPEVVKLLLDRSAKVDLQENDGRTALMSACANGHTEAEKLLLDRGAVVNLQKFDGWTALMCSCENDHLEAAKLLLDRGAKVDLQEKDGRTALMAACQNGHPEAAKLLLDRDAEADLQKSDGSTALMYTCENGHPEAAKLLLDHGAKADLQNKIGWTALMCACQKGHSEIAEMLLDRGAEVNLQETDGWTALMIACQKGHSETVEILLDRGVEMNLQSTLGWTALMWACRSCCTESARLLLDRGAKADQQADYGWTALMWACQNGRTEAAKLLLDRSAEVDLQDRLGVSALMWACQNGHAETAKLLLSRGAQTDLRQADGWTPLMLACQEGHVGIAKLLLHRGADVDQQDADGWSALMLACHNGRTKTARLLLDHGAKVDLQDAEGNTALVWTTQRRRFKLSQAKMDQRSVSIIELLCAKSDRLSFADLGGPSALRNATEHELRASAELLEFVSASSPFAPCDLPLGTLACFYARNVRAPQAAADLSYSELYFMGLKDSNQRHASVDRFRAAARAEQSGENTLDALALKVECLRDAHKRGQDAIDSNLKDLGRLLSLRPWKLAASQDFDAAMDTVREAKQTLKDLQSRVAHDVSLVAERDEARGKLACLMRATISGAFHYSIQRLEKNDDLRAAENICSRLWACLSSEPLADQDDAVPSDEIIERMCQAAIAAVATWKQREKVILARGESEASIDKLGAAAQPQDPGQLTRLQQLAKALEGAKDAFEKELRALRDDDPMDDMPLAEIRCALELIARRQAEARHIELARCRAAADAAQTEFDELVVCSKPSTAAVESLMDRIYEVQFKRAELELRIRHARGKRPSAGSTIDAGKLAKLEDELANLPDVYKLDRELRQERARVLRHAEREYSELLRDPAWCEQIGLSNEALVGVGKLELWLASATRANFTYVKPLSTKPGKEVHKVRDPEGRVMVLKSFHLADDAWHGRFYRQVQALAELRSAYLVHVEALFVDASFGCILMPCYLGGDLASWIRDNPHAADETRKRIAVGVLSGVHDLHQRKLVHCDIKPENIFLTEALTPVLGDFDGIQMSDVTMTQPLQTTFRYVAPELRAGGDLIGELQADDPTQRPSALEACGHEALHARPLRSYACPVCFERYPESEGVCCESEHFTCKSCLAAAVRAASQPSAYVQLKRDCSMLCVSPGCDRELPGRDLATAVPDEFETLLKIVREHFERETAAATETEIRRRLDEALREQEADAALREHVEHIQNKILTLSCPRCETAFVDFDGCCALKCSNSSCACYFCAWCLQSQGDSDACHAHIARCLKKPSGEADPFFSEREIVERAWCKLRAARVRAYVKKAVLGKALKAKVRRTLRPLLTADVVGLRFRF